jgi:hypothetical protein
MFWCQRIEHDKWKLIVPKFHRCRNIEAKRKRIDKRIKAYFNSPIRDVAERWRMYPEGFLKKLRLNWHYRTKRTRQMIEAKHFGVVGIPPVLPGNPQPVDVQGRPWSKAEVEWKIQQIKAEDERILAGPPNADMPEICKDLFPETKRVWLISCGIIVDKSDPYL